MRLLLLSLILSGFFPFHGHADESSIMIQTQNGVRFVSGGVGKDQQDALARVKDQFNLYLTFASKTQGHYLSDVKVRIERSDGVTVLDATTDGPKLFVELPAGRYLIIAERGASSLTQNVSIGGQTSKSAVFSFSMEKGDQ